MNNENNLANTYSLPPLSSTSNVGSRNGVMDGLNNISISTWIIIVLVFILILSYSGINVFSYLATLTNNITDYSKPVITNIVNTYKYITGQSIYVAAEGTKDVLNTATNFLDKGLTDIQNVATNIKDNSSPTSLQTNQVDNETSQETNNIQKNNTTESKRTTLNNMQHQQDEMYYQADDSYSSIQSASNKAGWCYIGESKGIRSCAQVGVNDTCMSGDIFPTRDICINPKLRA
jgi:hypothetical protein